MPKAAVGDIDLYYEIHGKGKPLVLIRGLGSNADHWYSQTSALAEKYQVIIFDNRGIGRSSKLDGKLSINMMANDTVGLLDALELDCPHIMGLSMGGMIAQVLALNHPERVSGLVLACTHPGSDKQVRAAKEVEDLFMEMVHTATPQAKAAAAPTLFDPKNLSQRPEIAQEYAEVSLKYPTDAKILTKQWNAILEHNVYDRLPEIKSPTLVLTGDADVLIPPGNSKILAQRIPNSKYVVVQGGGHQILVEQSKACNQVILDFLNGLDV